MVAVQKQGRCAQIEVPKVQRLCMEGYEDIFLDIIHIDGTCALMANARQGQGLKWFQEHMSSNTPHGGSHTLI
jgi:hypothetical protein